MQSAHRQAGYYCPGSGAGLPIASASAPKIRSAGEAQVIALWTVLHSRRVLWAVARGDVAIDVYHHHGIEVRMI